MFVIVTGVEDIYMEGANLEWDNIVTLIDADRLEHLSIKTRYDGDKTKFLVNGFHNGFHLGYKGPIDRQDFSDNIPFSIGSKDELWGKLMGEVKLGRVAGPFEVSQIPFENFMQSPISLVPKDQGTKTRLIFHLSYTFSDNGPSFNQCIDDTHKTVKYQDLDYAISLCLRMKRVFSLTEGVFYSKSDLSATFQQLLAKVGQRKWMMMKAFHPVTNCPYLFIEKCVPFGAGSSCQLFQEFSNSLRHIMEELFDKKFTVTNFLDDFLFIEKSEEECNRSVQQFINL